MDKRNNDLLDVVLVEKWCGAIVRFLDEIVYSLDIICNDEETAQG